jgi:hypothetical protein
LFVISPATAPIAEDSILKTGMKVSVAILSASATIRATVSTADFEKLRTRKKERRKALSNAVGALDVIDSEGMLLS